MPRMSHPYQRLSSSSSSSSSKRHFAGSPLTFTDTKVKISEGLGRDDKIGNLVKMAPFATVYTDESVQEAVKQMNAVGRGEALILDRDGNLAGIFTERDVVTKLTEVEAQTSSRPVSMMMTPVDKLIVVNENDKIGYCRKVMVANKIRRLPVLNSEKKPVGIVSISQIDSAVLNQDNEIESSKLYGNTLEAIQEQSRALANLIALEKGSELSTQDALRTGFVTVGAAVLAFLFQGDWVHDHEWISMSLTFLLGYIGIVFETYFEFNKAAIALLMSTALWVIYAGTAGASGITIPEAVRELEMKASEVSEVVFFLLGAMTIVEIVDSHQGFKVITDRISAKSKRNLMWIIGTITFFMSAILDNLTTTIVMVSLIRKILSNPEDRKLFGAMIVIAANAGGAWTPIGDVTTTMLWINGQISAIPTIEGLFLPSLVSVVLSILYLQNSIPADEMVDESSKTPTELAPRGQLVFGVGILSLLTVPLFKSLTGLPPYLGMLSSLGLMWTLTDAIHAGETGREQLMAPAALRKIDTSGVLFFLGILMSVGALDSAGILRSVAEFLDSSVPDRSLIASIIGLVSAVIDNVPLVAATMGM
jgi:Na+/H+ antiporter NhaD/arsenite permease-like protein/predicted transcriptional regulator